MKGFLEKQHPVPGALLDVWATDWLTIAQGSRGFPPVILNQETDGREMFPEGAGREPSRELEKGPQKNGAVGCMRP